MDFDEFYGFVFEQVADLLEGTDLVVLSEPVGDIVKDDWEVRYYQTWEEVQEFRQVVPRRSVFQYDTSLKGYILYVEVGSDKELLALLGF